MAKKKKDEAIKVNLPFERKVQILETEINRMEGDIEPLTKEVQQLETLIAEEFFLQTAFKQAGVKRESYDKEHQAELKATQNKLTKLKKDYSRLKDFRERLVQAHENGIDILS